MGASSLTTTAASLVEVKHPESSSSQASPRKQLTSSGPHLLLQLQVNQIFLHLLLTAQLPLQPLHFFPEQPVGLSHLPEGTEIKSLTQPCSLGTSPGAPGALGCTLEPLRANPWRLPPTACACPIACAHPTAYAHLTVCARLTAGRHSPPSAASAPAPSWATAPAQTSCSSQSQNPAPAGTASAPNPG